MTWMCSCKCYFEACGNRPAAPRRAEAKLLYQPSKRGTSQVTSQRESVGHNAEFRQALSRSTSALNQVSGPANEARLTLADSEQQRADTPEPFTQIHRRVRGFPQSALSKASGRSEVFIKLLNLCMDKIICFVGFTGNDESYLERVKGSSTSAGPSVRKAHMLNIFLLLLLLLPQ